MTLPPELDIQTRPTSPHARPHHPKGHHPLHTRVRTIGLNWANSCTHHPTHLPHQQATPPTRDHIQSRWRTQTYNTGSSSDNTNKEPRSRQHHHNDGMATWRWKKQQHQQQTNKVVLLNIIDPPLTTSFSFPLLKAFQYTKKTNKYQKKHTVFYLKKKNKNLHLITFLFEIFVPKSFNARMFGSRKNYVHSHPFKHKFLPQNSTKPLYVSLSLSLSPPCAAFTPLIGSIN